MSFRLLGIMILGLILSTSNAVQADEIYLPLTLNAGPRYVDNGDGTVTDRQTGLKWLQNANCFGRKLAWTSASNSAAQLNSGECGLTDGSVEGDWSLPTKEEWEITVADAVSFGCTLSGANNPPSLTDTEGIGCFADEDSPLFTDVVSSFYWSSTPHADIPHYVWGVLLYSGYIASSPECCYPGVSGYVWPVRGGQ